MRRQRTNLLSSLNEARLALLALLVGMVGLGAVLVSLISYYIATSNVIVNPVTDEQLQAPATATLIAYVLAIFSFLPRLFSTGLSSP